MGDVPECVDAALYHDTPVENAMTQANAWRRCNNCGTMNAATDAFCSRCGFALTNSVNTAQTSIKPHSSIPPGAQSVAHAPTVIAGARRVTGALQASDLLGGRYRIVRLVGKGGFGAVYQAQDERFQARRVVAVKEMSDARLSPADRINAMRDFRREADFLVQLRHPNLPDVSDFFEEAGKAYLIMEFIEGRTMEKLLEDAGGPLDEMRVMAWALQLCDVLDYLHSRPQPIVFRDLKPANVMVTSNNQVKLIDFGVARFFKPTAVKDTTALGSRGFAPLEQYGHGQSDARSDIYALGATLYNLLTNALPIDAPMRVVNPSTFLPPRQLNPHITRATDDIILRALENDPQKRFQSARDFSQAIVGSGVLGSIPPQALFPTSQIQSAQPTLPGSRQALIPPPSPSRPLVSRRALLLGGTGVAVLAVGAAAWPFISRGGFGSSGAGPSITLNFIYSTEKARWLTDAIAAFHKSNAAHYQGKNIQVQAIPGGSLDVTSRILSGEIKPVAWSPASSLELNRLNLAWRQRNAGQGIVVNDDLRPLVLSPLVFAVWNDRAKVLLSSYGHIDWDSLSVALQSKGGWAALGGSQSWQAVKLGQTRPDESNSGLLAITLMAYAFFQKTLGLTTADIDDPGFQSYLNVFESAVTAFGHSSGTYLEQEVILKGPGAYDITFTYENLVLMASDEIKQRQLESLRAFYPHVNIESDHPFALLRGPWVSQEQQRAAVIFRDFLLDIPQQQLALRYGLRPTHPNVHVGDQLQGNLFLAPDIPDTYSAVQSPAGSVVDELLKQWLNRYHDVPTTDG